MTEAEWQNCAEPERMLRFARGKASDRQLRLFMVSCCRRIGQLIPSQAGQDAVAVAERWADGEANKQDVEMAIANCRREQVLALSVPLAGASEAVRAIFASLRSPAHHDYDEHDYNEYEAGGFEPIGFASLEPRSLECAELAATAAHLQGIQGSHQFGRRNSRWEQADSLRCILGNPYRDYSRQTYLPKFLDATATQIATAIYTDHAFDRLPILADALEDAGCMDAEILNHCRGSGVHVRGCWVVDLLTGKT